LAWLTTFRYAAGWAIGYYITRLFIEGVPHSFAISVAAGWWLAAVSIAGAPLDRAAMTLIVFGSCLAGMASQYLRYVDIEGAASIYYFSITTLTAAGIFVTPLLLVLVLRSLLRSAK
jgi:hypothetical protein